MKTDTPLTFGSYVMDETDPRLEVIRLGLEAAAEDCDAQVELHEKMAAGHWTRDAQGPYDARKLAANEARDQAARIRAITPSDVLKKGKS